MKTKYYLILSKDLEYINTNYNELNDLAEEVSRLLNAYSNAIKASV